MIIFDENIEEFWINLAKENLINFISIRDSYSGLTDIEVIELASKFNGLIVTEDKDFGELVFSYGYKCSVLLIRYDKPLYDQI
jgi:predicted nuclease of predicted toxin-antitoxin system